MGTVHFTVLNWGTFQGEAKRYTHTSWFRVENRLWMHALWGRLTDAEFRGFMFLLMFTSMQSNKEAEVQTELDLLCRMSNLKADVIVNCLKKLAELGIVEVHGELPVTSPCVPGERPVLPNGTLPYPTQRGTPPGEKTGLTKTKNQNLATVVATYVDAFKGKYGANASPSRNAKDIAALKRVMEAEGVERTQQLVQVFLQMRVKWFEEKCYDLITFENNVNKISVALSLGTDVTHITEGEWTRIFNQGGTNGVGQIPGADPSHG